MTKDRHGARCQIPDTEAVLKDYENKKIKTKDGRLLVRNFSGQCKETKANTSRTNTIRLFSEIKKINKCKVKKFLFEYIVVVIRA